MQSTVGHTRRGFTLIEMMIALVITMMMVFAMVEAFRWIGEATTTGRAQIEMAGQLRAARYRLELDLNGATVPLRPWVNNQAHPGYFELIEGAGSDTNPGQFICTTQTSYVNFNFADPNDNLAASSMSLYGDLDDVLMLTVRNDSEPFRGRYVTVDANGQNPQTIMIESNLAEIIWWAELNDTKPESAPDGKWSPGETFTIRRRVLLIRPDLVNQTTPNATMTLYSATQNNPAFANPNNTYPKIDNADQQAVARFLDENDISIRRVYDSNSNFIGYAPNSLAELSLRHNRTAHFAINNSTTGLDSNSHISPLMLDYLPGTNKNHCFLPGFSPTSNHYGEEVILTNVTAFDFRVWDPNVPIMKDAAGLNEALVPGDPGYASQVASSTNAGNSQVIGLGAYVDLGALANDNTTLTALTSNSSMSNPPALINPATGNPVNYHPVLVGFPNYKALLYPFNNNMGTITMNFNSNYPFVYDPWPIAYEKDGFNQDNDTDNNGNQLIDEGTDGLDENNLAGPDDADERETSPPYPYPLKSIRVSIRMYEADTRQVRQTTHEMNLAQ